MDNSKQQVNKMQSQDQTVGGGKRPLQTQTSSQEIQAICNSLLSKDHKLDGLTSLEAALQRMAAQNQNFLCLDENVMYIDKVFKGIKTCLNVDENEEETLMKTNQILYDLMPDILKHPVELQPEMSTLIPALVENLGNPKANVRKQTHKVIGTYVKLSKKLEPVLLHLIKHGLGNSTNQRTRQHSMLVIPALLSLKSSVIESRPPPLEMQLLVDEVIVRLRDPEEIVAKTARKLLAELHKLYPNHFQTSFIDSIPNQTERQLGQLVLQNKIEEAQALIVATTPTVQPVRPPQPSSQLSFQQKEILNETKPIQMAAYGKSLQPQSQQFTIGASYQNVNTQLPNQSQTPQPTQTNQKMVGNLIPQGPLKPTQPQNQPNLIQNQQLRELSVVGREIIGSTNQQNLQKQLAKPSDSQIEPKPNQSQTKQTTDASTVHRNNSNNLEKAGAHREVQQAVVPIQQPKLAFGFIETSIIEALDENNQWKDRTQAIDQLEYQVANMKVVITNSQANDLLQFIITLVADINFKISLASLKIIAMLLGRNLIKNQLHYAALVAQLVDKLADSKSVVRDATLECCALLIDQFKPLSFLQQIYKSFQNSNWHVREGLQILVARCLIENQAAGNDSQTLMSPKVLEELTFSIKVEDKPRIRQMTIDNLALALRLSKDRLQLIQIIQNGLGMKTNIKSEIEQEFFDQILFREQTDSYPMINTPTGRIQFQPWTTKSEEKQEIEQTRVQFDNMSEVIPRTSAYSAFNQNENFKTGSTIENDKNNAITSPPFNLLVSVPLPEFNANQQSSPSRSSNVLMSPKERQTYAETVHPFSAGLIKPPLNSFKQESMNTAHQIQQQLITNQNKSQLSLESIHSTNTQRQITKLVTQERYLPASTQNQTVQSIDDDKKISMWLPNFQNQQNDDPRRVNSRISDNSGGMLQDNFLFSAADDPKRINSKTSDQPVSHLQPVGHGQPPLHTAKKVQRITDQTLSRGQMSGRPNINLDATQSSIQQFDDNQSVFTQTTLVSSSNKPEAIERNQVQKQVSEGNRSPLFSDAKRSSLDTQDKFRNGFGHQASSQNAYIPEQHKNQPRTIQSNQDKQRLLANSTTNSSGSNSNQNSEQSSQQNQAAAPKSIDKNQINDRLTLLKSTFKYKNSKGDNQSEIGRQSDDIQETRISQHEPEPQPMNAYQAYDNRRVGPVKAAHLNVYDEQKSQKKPNTQMQATQVQLKPRQASSAAKPPPLNQARSVENNFKFDQQLDRHNSVDNQMSHDQIFSEKKANNKLLISPVQGLSQPALSYQESIGASYDIVEEPLYNPGNQYSQAINDLKSSDWSKQFEACNTIRRIAQYHKQLISQQPSVFKELVKPVESLRSQVSKNACLALQALFSNAATRDTDPYIDIVTPMLLKRAADTNQFISEQAEETLLQIVLHCTETRVFNCFQQQTLRTNQAKEKVCQCYNLLIERLGNQKKLKQFVSVDRLVSTIVIMLGESAAEVRNQAKICIFSLQTAAGSQYDFDQILQKCHLNERQLDQVRKVLQSEDKESLSQYVNTRYGQLRGTSGQSSGLQMKPSVSGINGTDGFSRRSAGGLNNQMMQQTFLSGNESIGPNSMAGYKAIQNQNQSVYNASMLESQKQSSTFGLDNTQNAFKKRTTSVSKPVDRDLMDEFKGLVDACNNSDWQKRLKAIDDIQEWATQYSRKIKSAQSSSFISLIDVYCKLLQDNNTKVLSRAQQSFQNILANPDLGALLNSNLTMIVQALTQNLCSTSPGVKAEGESLMDMLQEIVIQESRGSTNSLIQPLTSQVNLTTCRAKPQLVYRLASLVQRVDKSALLERYLSPLLQPGNKIQQEANGNQQLKQALQSLEEALAS